MNSPTQHLAPFAETLPHCVTVVLVLAEELRLAALRPLPDLDSRPKSRKAARSTLAGVAAWGREVERIRAGLNPPGHPPDADPVSLREAFDISGAGASLQYAADVLGSPPSFVTGHAVSRAVVAFEAGGTSDPERRGLDPVKDWGEIVADIRSAYMAAYMQAMLIVGWIRERTEALSGWMFPAITLTEATRAIAVLSAGCIRTDKLTKAHATALTDLATTGRHHTESANTVRGSSRRTLLGRVPELVPWVTQAASSPGMKRGPGRNDATFVINPQAQQRITIVRTG